MSLREQFRTANPAFPLLTLEDRAGLVDLLERLEWLEAAETVESVAPAGDGNMNLTLRVVTSKRSLIVKQARPWVEKYDVIAAPFERSTVERRFYERVRAIQAVAERMPTLIAADDESHLLLFEDLGEAADGTALYVEGRLSNDDASSLGAWLGSLHEATRGGFDDGLTNRAMRALNHEHIFVFPLDPNNGLELDAHEPGLERAAERLQKDVDFRRVVREMGERYLADGPCLLHGDFFRGAGSKLKTAGAFSIPSSASSEIPSSMPASRSPTSCWLASRWRSS